MAKLFQTRDVKMEVNLSRTPLHKGVGIDTKKNFAPAAAWDKAIFNVTDKREWLRIESIDHRQPLQPSQRLMPARRGTSQPRCSIFIHKVRRWRRMVGSRCGPDVFGQPAALFESLSAEHHHTKGRSRARSPGFVKRQNLAT
jgi:hypothetical protein